MDALLAGAPEADHGFAVIVWLGLAVIVCAPPLFVVGIIVVVHWAVSQRGSTRKPGR
jgi:hypothetical protein